MRPFVISVLLITATIGIVTYIARMVPAPERSASTLKELFERAAVEEVVSVNNKIYTVERGQVFEGAERIEGDAETTALVLAYKKVAARRAPLFAIPGVDPERMRVVLGVLEESRDTLMTQQKTAREAEYVRTSLYPVGMLYALTTLEDARLSFISSGSDADAQRYEEAQQNAVKEYTRALDHFERAFAELIPDTMRRYATPTVLIGKQEVLSALKVLREGVEKTAERIETREACTKGKEGSCLIEDLILPTFFAPTSSPVRAEQLARAKKIRTVLKETSHLFDNALGERMILLTQNDCAARDPGAPLFVIRHLKPPYGLEHSGGVYVGNWYFVRVPSGSTYADQPYLKSFTDNGIEYVSLFPLSYYECPEADRVQSDLFATREILLFAEINRLSTYATGTRAAHLRELEAKLLNDELLSESDALQYLATAAPLLKTSLLPGALKGKISSLILQYLYGGVGLYQAILDVGLAEESNIRLQERGVPIDFSAANLFFTRNALPALFLTHNPSVVGTPAPFFIQNTLPPEDQPYVLFSSFEAKPDSLTTLFRTVQFYTVNYER